MPSCCVCYTTDVGYLLPTFVSAVQARQHTPPDVADIAIFSIGSPTQADSVFRHACAMEGIRFLSIPPERVQGAGAMLARLFLDRIAPGKYGQLLYIDGDTQIYGSLAPLLQADVPDGTFLAASDPMTFSMSAHTKSGKDLSPYFAALGFNPSQTGGYFNSGVLRINRAGWDKTGQEAWTMFQKLREHTRFPDQDALNLVAAERRLPMSLTWNFPIFLRNAGLDSLITPHIIHYMGSPKPWQGRFMPWGSAAHETYLQAVQRHPALAPFLTSMPFARRVRYTFQQRYKQRLEQLTWGNGPHYREILRYEQDCTTNGSA